MSASDPTPSRSSPEDLFHQAKALSSPQEREALLARACGEDEQLRARVEALLRADADAGSFMETRTRHAGATEPASIMERPGQTVGRYKLLQLIGEGGFGAVFLAEQNKPVSRRVALKIIKPGMDSRMVAARFEAERQALALMEHPHIARVFDGGITEPAMGARPYFVMEYVVGDPITKFADAHRLSIEDRLNLFTQVCEAVQHAHTKGIIHRDLKPGNVLVSMVDGKPFAKVIDFGIAKSLASRLTEKTLFTEHRQLIGTPEYMSPEQAEGSPDIDTRADVYALGVLLYELLSGATPFDAQRLRSAAFGELQRIIKEEEPPAPSIRLSRGLETLAATAAARRVEPARLSTMVKGELDWIVMKALDKDRARRYETPNQLAADVRRHLAGEAVVAAPARAGYRLRKFVRRNKSAVVAGTAIAAALLLGIAGTTWQWQEARAANASLRTEHDATRDSLRRLATRVAEDWAASGSEIPKDGILGAVGVSGLWAAVRVGPSSQVRPVFLRLDSQSGSMVDVEPESVSPEQSRYLLDYFADHTLQRLSDNRIALQTANARLLSQRDIAREAMDKVSAALTWDGCPEEERHIAGEAFVEEWSKSRPEFASAPEAERQLRALGAYAVLNATRLREETSRARLAEARIVVGAFEREDAGGADEAYLRTLDLPGAAASLALYLGPHDAETVKAEKLLADRTLEGQALFEKRRELSARREAAGGAVMGIDIALWSALAGEFWSRRDLPACLDSMHRVGRHLREAYGRDARNCVGVVYPWLPANWFISIDQPHVDARAGELEGLSLASLYRVLAAHGEDAERLGAIERAEALDAGAGRSPHPANVALRAELAMRDETAEARALASRLLDEADRLAASTAWVGDAECRYWMTRAKNIVQAKPTTEQQLDAAMTERRLAEASATLAVALQYGYGKKLEQDLEWIYRTRLELLGPGHTATLEGAQCLTLRSCSADHGLDRDRALSLSELGAAVDAYYANGGAGCWKSVRLDALLSFEGGRDEADGRRRLARAAEALPGLVARGDWQALQDEFYRMPGEAGSEFEMELCYFPSAKSSELYGAIPAGADEQLDWRRRWLGRHWGPVVRGYLTWYYWDRCLSPDRGAETYEHAERQLTHVNRCFGENAAAMEGVALAQMRLKRYADALDSAAGAAALCAKEGRSVTATIVAVEALANIGMGRAEPAQQSLARLRALATDPRSAEVWPDARALLIEAEAIVGDRGR